MAYNSKKSQAFVLWLRHKLGVVGNDGLVERLADLEKAARMFAHSVDRIGEPSPEDVHAVVRASKNLQAEYENKR